MNNKQHSVMHQTVNSGDKQETTSKQHQMPSCSIRWRNVI